MLFNKEKCNQNFTRSGQGDSIGLLSNNKPKLNRSVLLTESIIKGVIQWISD